MPPIVLKYFAGQSTGRTDGRTDRRTDGQSSDYILPPLGSILANMPLSLAFLWAGNKLQVPLNCQTRHIILNYNAILFYHCSHLKGKISIV